MLEMVPGRDLWRVDIDRSQLEAALLNLAINARDAMPAGGQLRIETSNQALHETVVGLPPDFRPGDYVLLAVSDTGTGIAPQHLDRVFDPFFTTKEAGKGTGLGLSMVYGFIQQSAGAVSLYSEERGTVIRLYLPRSTETVRARPVSEPVTMPRGSEKVLVVEDRRDVRATLCLQLADLGYQVVEAGDAASALRRLEEKGDIALVLTDVVMPGGIDGIELARQVREGSPGISVVLTSGYMRVGSGTEQREVLLSKPYTQRELARVVRRVLDRRVREG